MQTRISCDACEIFLPKSSVFICKLSDFIDKTA